MTFMQAMGHGPEWWLILDGPQGGEVIPGNLFDHHKLEQLVAYIQDCERPCPTPRELHSYTQNHSLYEAELRWGYGVHASASGYMDQTEWEFYYTKKEAMKRIRELQRELEGDEY